MSLSGYWQWNLVFLSQVEKDLPLLVQSKDKLGWESWSNQPCHMLVTLLFALWLVEKLVNQESTKGSSFHIVTFVFTANCCIWGRKWWRCRSCFLSFSYRQTEKEITQVQYALFFVVLFHCVSLRSCNCYQILNEIWKKRQIISLQ